MMNNRSVPHFVVLLLVAVLYITAARLGLSLAFLHASVSPVWPPTGVALAALMCRGYGMWPAVLAGAFIANLAGLPPLTAGAIAIGNTLEALTGAWLLRRYVGERSPFYRAPDVIRFTLFAGVISPAVAATIGNLSLCCTAASPWSNFGSLWLTWWLGDGVGALVVAPLLLTWIDKPAPHWPARRWAEGALLLAALAMVALIVFRGLLFGRSVNYPLGHLTIPFLLWAALRFGPRGVATALGVLSLIAIWGTTRGYGPFAEANLNEALLLLQGFVAALSIAATLLAAVVIQHQLARETAQFLASIVQSTGEAVIGKKLDGTIISWNRGAERLYGYAPSEVMGRHISLLLPPDAGDDFAEQNDKLRRCEAIADYETARLAKDGRRLVVALTMSPIKDETGQVIGASTIARDITVRKQAEDESQRLLQREQAARASAEAADRAKDDFLAVLSHELRTPLAAVMGWVDILIANAETHGTPSSVGAAARLSAQTGVTAEPDPAVDLSTHGLQVIRRNARVQLRIIEDMLDVSRIVAGKLQLHRSPVLLYTVVQSAIADMTPAATDRSIRIEAMLDKGLPPMMGDAYRLHQVVWNLLSNAIKFTPQGGAVQVRLEPCLKDAEAGARLTVSDNGEGIAPEVLPHIFDRFRQADSTMTRRYGGLGLGLAIVRYLVEAHGGTVAAASPGVGHGAVFTITLACGDDPSLGVGLTPIADETSRDGRARLTGRRILIVDDDADAREMIATILGLQGAQTRAAASVAEGLATLREWKPDLLISDLGMPERDGYDLIRQVRQQEAMNGGHIPALAVTAYASADDAERTRAAGFDLHLPKPIDPAELIAAIAQVAPAPSVTPMPPVTPV